MENWKIYQIREYKDNRNKARWGSKRIYEVSDLGRCRINGIIYEPKQHDEYLGFCNNRIHRIVAKLFVPNPDNKPCVDHINGDKHDNRAVNLRWVTYKENNDNPYTRNKFLNTIRSDEYRKMLSDRMHKRYEDPEERLKVSIIQKKRYEDPEERLKVTNRNYEYWSNPDNRKKMSEKMKGNTNGFKKKII